MSEVPVTQIQRYSISDGPGIRTTIFLKGCPLKCPWCHNPETQNMYSELYFDYRKCNQCSACAKACPVTGAIDLTAKQIIDRGLCIRCMKCVDACVYNALKQTCKSMTIEEVIGEVMRDSNFYTRSGGGVTISGGEPLYYPEFTANLLKALHSKGIHTCLDTSGYATFSTWEKVLPYVNVILYDVKHIDSTLHKKIIGVPNDVILDNLKKVASRVPVILRIPIIPGFNANGKVILAIAELGCSLNIKRCSLLPYHGYAQYKYHMLGRMNDFYRVEPPSKELIEEFKGQLVQRGLIVTVEN